jgi:hypothetical protein
LIDLVHTLHWVSLNRNQKRVKSLLIEKLESAREQICPVLDTDQGRRAVISAWALVSQKKIYVHPSGGSDTTSFRLPAETTIGFYLSHPRDPKPPRVIA